MQRTALTLSLVLIIIGFATAILPHRSQDVTALEDPDKLVLKIEEVDEKDLPKGNMEYLWEEFQKHFPAVDIQTANTQQPEGISLDEIVNIGKKVWDIVEKNQPSLDISTSSASAMPNGITDWKQMGGWRDPVSKAYRITYENLYGMKVVDFTFRLVFIYGGSYNGVGKYLTGITVVPSNIDVIWGYKFDCKVVIPDVVNTGTPDNPVAGAQVQLQWTVSTVIKKNVSTSNWWVRGDGIVKQL